MRFLGLETVCITGGLKNGVLEETQGVYGSTEQGHSINLPPATQARLAYAAPIKGEIDFSMITVIGKESDIQEISPKIASKTQRRNVIGAVIG